MILTLAQRELVRFFRQRNRVIGALIQPIMFWGLFSLGLRSNDLGFDVFFPGTIAMILLFTAIFATISIIEDRREGFLQSVLVAPAPRWAMVLGKILGGATIALLQALIFLALGWVTLAGPCPARDFAGGIVDGGDGGGADGLGFVIAWRMESTQGFHAIMSVFLFSDVVAVRGVFSRGRRRAGSRCLGSIRSRTGSPACGIICISAAAKVRWWTRCPSLTLCWVVSLAFAVLMVVLCWRMAATRTTGDLL